VDPAVLTSYHQDAKAALYARTAFWSNITGIAHTRWAEVAASPAIDWSNPQWAVAYNKIECCDLTPGRDLVDWDKGCRRVDVLGGTNYTHQWLRARGGAAL